MASASRSASVFWQSDDENEICKIIESKSASGSGNIASGREPKLFPALIRSECHGPACRRKPLILKS